MPLVCVFDLGNVLLFVHEHLFFDRVRPRCRAGAQVRETFYREYERAAVDRGGDFGQVHSALVREVGLDMPMDEFRLAWNDIFTPNPPMIELVRRTPRPRLLLSNTNEPHAAWIREHYPEVLAPFDECIFSNEIGARKPDVAAFRHVERITGRPAGEHLFVDDLPRNVEGARKAGWRAVQFVGVEDLRRRLEALGALRAEGSGR